MELLGILKEKFDIIKVSEKFSKRDFVIETEHTTKYPQFISVQVTQDKCSLLDSHNIGDEVKIQINIKGRIWDGPQGIKYFNTIEAWKIEAVNVVKQEPHKYPDAPIQNNVNNSVSNNDDLPF